MMEHELQRMVREMEDKYRAQEAPHPHRPLTAWSIINVATVSNNFFSLPLHMHRKMRQRIRMLHAHHSGLASPWQAFEALNEESRNAIVAKGQLELKFLRQDETVQVLAAPSATVPRSW